MKLISHTYNYYYQFSHPLIISQNICPRINTTTQIAQQRNAKNFKNYGIFNQSQTDGICPFHSNQPIQLCSPAPPGPTWPSCVPASMFVIHWSESLPDSSAVAAGPGGPSNNLGHCCSSAYSVLVYTQNSCSIVLHCPSSWMHLLVAVYSSDRRDSAPVGTTCSWERDFCNGTRIKRLLNKIHILLVILMNLKID